MLYRLLDQGELFVIIHDKLDQSALFFSMHADLLLLVLLLPLLSYIMGAETSRSFFINVLSSYYGHGEGQWL